MAFAKKKHRDRLNSGNNTANTYTSPDDDEDEYEAFAIYLFDHLRQPNNNYVVQADFDWFFPSQQVRRAERSEAKRS